MYIRIVQEELVKDLGSLRKLHPTITYPKAAQTPNLQLIFAQVQPPRLR